MTPDHDRGSLLVTGVDTPCPLVRIAPAFHRITQVSTAKLDDLDPVWQSADAIWLGPLVGADHPQMVTWAERAVRAGKTALVDVSGRTSSDLTQLISRMLEVPGARLLGVRHWSRAIVLAVSTGGADPPWWPRDAGIPTQHDPESSDGPPSDEPWPEAAGIYLVPRSSTRADTVPMARARELEAKVQRLRRRVDELTRSAQAARRDLDHLRSSRSIRGALFLSRLVGCFRTPRAGWWIAAPLLLALAAAALLAAL